MNIGKGVAAFAGIMQNLRASLRPHSHLLIALAVAFIAAWPLLAEPGLLNTRGGGDSPFLLQRLHQLETAVRDGHFPVRWMPDANYGYGYPFYNFYAPLSIYIAAAFRLFGFTMIRAIHMAQLTGFLTAAWGMYKLVHYWSGNQRASLLAAIAYTVAPFHMVNVYVRGDSLAEFWAMAFYPLIILATEHLLQANSPHRQRDIALLAVAYAALILSHNISALIFTPFLGLFILLRLLLSRERDWSAIGYGLLALLLALTLSAWFFIPALVEQPLAQLDPVTEGYFHYSNHFREANLAQTTFFFNYDVNGGNAFRMGLVQAITAVLGTLFLLNQWRRNQQTAAITLFTLSTLLIATFMITPLSRPLWEHLPLLPFTQFPWRFLSVQAFATALAASTLAHLPQPQRTLPLIGGVLILSSLGRLQTDHLRLTDADITAERLAHYEWFTGNIGSTVSAEYLPPTVQPRPYTSQWVQSGHRDSLNALSGTVSALSNTRRTTWQQWQITTTEAATLIFPTLYWPGWTAYLNNTAVPIHPAPSTGLISLELDAGIHNVELRLHRTPIRLWAELISLTAVFILFWLLWSSFAWRPFVYGVATLLLISVIVRLWPASTLPNHDLTWDFSQMGYLHHDVDGVEFTDGSRLIHYTYSHEEQRPAQSLTITFEWQGHSDQTATLALFTPAIHRQPPNQPPAPALASQTQPLQNGINTFNLPLIDNIPIGLVVPRLVVDDARPLLPSGQTRGHLFLRPLYLYPWHSDDDSNHLNARAHNVWAEDDVLNVQMAWFTPTPLSHNYNLSLRLVDSAGTAVSSLDHQPGYGFTPSSLWPSHTQVNDWLTLALPSQASNPPYALVARLYEVDTGVVVLTRRLGQLDQTWQFQPNQPTFTLPDNIETTQAIFVDGETAVIQLQGYELTQLAEAITLQLYWQALTPGQTDYIRFVHLLDANTPIPLAQNDAMPRQNSYPTSQWVSNELIDETVVLLTDDLPSGTYQLAVGWYRREEGFPRLTAVDSQNAPLPDNRHPLPLTITIP